MNTTSLRLGAAFFSIGLFACSDDGTATQNDMTGASAGTTTGSGDDASVTLDPSPSTTGITDGGSAGPGGSTSGDSLTSSATDPSGATDPGTADGGTTAGGANATIYEIQMGEVGEGADVTVDGVVVTAVAPAGNALFVQEPDGGPYSGVYVYVDALDIGELAIGDEVTIEASVAEYQDLTELDASAGSVVETGSPGPLAPQDVALSDLATEATAEAWEAVLLTIEEGEPLEVSSVPGDDEFALFDGTDEVIVDDYLYSVFDNPGAFADFGVGASFTSVTGVLNYNDGAFKVAPRSETDLAGYEPSASNGASIDDLSDGDLVVTEIMYDPTCVNDACEWIEIYNNAGQDVNLLGLLVRDSAANENEVMASVVLPAGAYAVIADGSAATWPYAGAIDHLVFITMPALNNAAPGDAVSLANTASTLDSTATYTPVGGDDGYSWKLDGDPSTTDNAVAGNWCYSPNLHEGNDFASPGEANDAGCADL